MAEEYQKSLLNEPFFDEDEYIANLFKLESIRLQLYLCEESINEQGESVAQNKYLPELSDVSYILEKKTDSHAVLDYYNRMIEWENYIEDRREASETAGLRFRIDDYIARSGLGSFGRSALILSLMAAVDSDYRGVFQYFNRDVDKAFPTLGLCCKLFFYHDYDNSAKYFNLLAAELDGFKLLFPELLETEYPLSEELMPDSLLISLILGQKRVYPDYISSAGGEAEYTRKGWNADVLTHFRTQEISDIKAIITRAGIRLAGQTMALLKGEKGAGKHAVLQSAMDRLGGRVIYFNASHFNNGKDRGEGSLQRQLRVAMREAYLTGELLVVEGISDIDLQTQRHLYTRLYNEVVPRLNIVFVLADDEEYEPQESRLVTFELKELNEIQRLETWRLAADQYEFEDNKEELLTAVANTFVFTPGKICEAMDMASKKTDEGVRIRRKELYEACYTQTDHRLQEKAKRVKPVFSWDDIKLPQEEKTILREICQRVKNKHIVMSQWHFEEKLPYGAGMPIVFAGPPGTGKTMAAQVLAGEIGMEMYQIDLSQLVDKYIGETEKNIKMVFEQAKKSNSILFFDEADAIFGKRVDGSSSNDRYANIESSMLLQCVESYSGISILATNNFAAMDPAFVRRFKYMINFTAPDTAMRFEIWKSVFPKEAPVDDEVDFQWLARTFAITGAFIKNIALTAAFLAAEDGSEINMLHILKGVKRELTKEGRKIDISELGNYGYLYDEL